MATIDLSKATQLIDFTDPNLVKFETVEAQTATNWSWLTPSGHDIELTGSGLTYGPNGHAVGGTIKAISIDLGNNNFDSPDIRITGINAQAASLDDGPQSFWRVLDGNDTIIGPNAGGIHHLFGDALEARNGATGGNDVFRIGTGQTWAAGDAWSVGSETSGSPAVTYRGGNDTFTNAPSDGFFELIGDASYVKANGTLIGGDDQFMLRSGGQLSGAIGDVLIAEGTAGHLASVTGGDDTISVSGTVFSATLVGDVYIQKANSFVRGGDDIISGSNGGSTIVGDVLDVGDNRMIAGNDTIWGGDDTDRIYGDVISSGAMSDVVNGNDTIHGGGQNDTIYGDGGGSGKVSGGNDLLYGDQGDDTIFGNQGNDLLDGGVGKDDMRGGEGNDIYVVDQAGDYVGEGDNQGIDTVETTLQSYTLLNYVENLTYTGGSPFVGVGNAVANTIKGGAGADSLSGNEGNDRLYGSAGVDLLYGNSNDDVLNGGAGADTLDGGTGFDLASYAGSEEAVHVSLGVGVPATGDAIGDTFTGIEGLEGTSFNDVLGGDAFGNQLLGGDGNDVLSGLGGNDLMNGGNGSDLLVGGLGNDKLIGGAGVDTFAFNAPVGATNVDTVMDWSGSDFIRLAKGIFSAIGSSFTANEFRADATGVAGDADDRIVYETDTGKLFYDTNGNAAGGVVQIAQLQGHPTLEFADFQFL